MQIDTHCHLSYEDYDNLDEVVKNIDIAITSGCNDKTNKEVLDIVSKYNNIYGTLGIHPEEIDNISETSFDFIEENLSNKKIVAVGEIGLDYYWVKDNKEEQKKLLRKQMKIAEKYNMPVVIHSRDAIEDTYNILKDYKVKGVIHCFSSSLDMAKKFIKLGYKIGIGGVVTFKNSKKLQEVVEGIDLKDIILETDSPYIAPEPLRGTKNVPYNIYYVAKKIAEIKNIDIDEVFTITGENTTSLFDLKI